MVERCRMKLFCCIYFILLLHNHNTAQYNTNQNIFQGDANMCAVHTICMMKKNTISNSDEEENRCVYYNGLISVKKIKKAKQKTNILNLCLYFAGRSVRWTGSPTLINADNFRLFRIESRKVFYGCFVTGHQQSNLFEGINEKSRGWASLDQRKYFARKNEDENKFITLESFKTQCNRRREEENGVEKMVYFLFFFFHFSLLLRIKLFGNSRMQTKIMTCTMN